MCHSSPYSQSSAQSRGCISFPSCASPMLTISQEWKTNHFQRITLKQLGLRVQLGHMSGAYCPAPQKGHSDFLVIAHNGFHPVNIYFCGCTGAPPHYLQLLEMRWWPSTPLAPQTATTMDLLRTFHIMNLQARVSPTDFYQSLERMTDGQGSTKLPVCVSESMTASQLTGLIRCSRTD